MELVTVGKFNRSDIVTFTGGERSDFPEVGLYKVYSGCRGELEQLEYLGDSETVEYFESDEELISKLEEEISDEDGIDLEYAGVFMYDYGDELIYGVTLSEEFSYEYYYINNLD